MMKKISIIISIFVLGFVHAQNGTDNCIGLREDWGYVDVRPGVHMFWVTYHTEMPGDRSTIPLIMWLQGGPGSSSVGYGNFWLLGPCDIFGNSRAGRWSQLANLMFVDNPVGSGYSYVDDLADLTTTNAEIAQDLVTLLISNYQQYPEQQTMPFFIYSESYGGKMAIDTALLLLQAIDNGDIICNFQGVVLGDSWTSPMDYVNTWGGYLYEMGFVNEAELVLIEASAAETQAAVDAEQWVEATVLWAATESVIISTTGGIDFYNVHAENSSFYSPTTAAQRYKDIDQRMRDIVSRHLAAFADDPLDAFMNGEQKLKWNIPVQVTWGGQSGTVFNTLAGDFMKPVVDSVSEAINLNRIHVGVYNGNLDLICDTPGTYRWINNMIYAGKPEFDSTARVNNFIDEYPNLSWYYQRNGPFSLNTFLRAGHMMPLDNPSGALDMINFITSWGAEAAATYNQRKSAEDRLSDVKSKKKEQTIEKVKELPSEVAKPEDLVADVAVQPATHDEVPQIPEVVALPAKPDEVPQEPEVLALPVKPDEAVKIPEPVIAKIPETHSENKPQPAHRNHHYIKGRHFEKKH